MDHVQLITKILAYKRIDPETGYLVLRDDTYATFLRTDGKNIEGLNYEQRVQLLTNWGQFNGQFLDDYEVISSKFPTNTDEQQDYWGRKYKHWSQVLRETTDERLKMQAQRRLRAAQHYIQDERAIEKTLYNFDFIFVFFGKTADKLHSSVRRAKNLARENAGNRDDIVPLVFHELKQSEKEDVLFRLNNPNARMK